MGALSVRVAPLTDLKASSNDGTERRPQWRRLSTLISALRIIFWFTLLFWIMANWNRRLWRAWIETEIYKKPFSFTKESTCICQSDTHVPITPKRKSKTPLSEIFFLSPIMYKYSKNPWGQIILMKFLFLQPGEVFHKKSWVVVVFYF